MSFLKSQALSLFNICSTGIPYFMHKTLNNRSPKIFILILIILSVKAGSKSELQTGTTLVNREIYTSFLSGIKILQTILFTGTVTSASGSGSFINLKFTIIISSLQI